MEKTSHSAVWTDAGYALFCEEGLDGLQVERIARIVQLNKSGFYHYFGDHDLFCEELLKVHKDRIAVYLRRVVKANSIDPDILHILMEFKLPCLFQMQLCRIRKSPFKEVADWVDQSEDVVIAPLWCKYLGVDGCSDLAMRYFDIVRSMFYARINHKNYTFPYLQGLLNEAKEVINQLSDQKVIEANLLPPLKAELINTPVNSFRTKPW